MLPSGGIIQALTATGENTDIWIEKGKWTDEGNIYEWFWGVHMHHIMLFSPPNKLMKFQTRNRVLGLFRILPIDVAVDSSSV